MNCKGETNYFIWIKEWIPKQVVVSQDGVPLLHQEHLEILWRHVVGRARYAQNVRKGKSYKKMYYPGGLSSSVQHEPRSWGRELKPHTGYKDYFSKSVYVYIYKIWKMNVLPKILGAASHTLSYWSQKDYYAPAFPIFSWFCGSSYPHHS